MQKIEHRGIVDEVTDKGIKVKIISLSACASCHAKGACSVSDIQEKEVNVAPSGNFKPGDQVMVIGSGSQGLQAAWWAYILPVALIMAALFITFSLTNNESLAGIMSLLILIPFYHIIRRADKAMKKRFQFTIKSINE
jgi:sigma-E factor negative regulatory protein RseC